MIYRDYELLELFESFPEVYDKEAGMYKYRRQDEYGLILDMNLVLCEGTCILTLFHKDLKNPLFDLDCGELEEIFCEKDRMIIRRSNELKDVIVDFRPGYSIKFEKRS